MVAKRKKISFLVFAHWSERIKDSSFDGAFNIGVYMLKDVAMRSGIEIGFCSVDTAKDNDLVLVSLTSIPDMLAFYKSVARHPDWQPCSRKFKVYVGGFGMQNYKPIVEYADKCWFGRCENEFVRWITDDDFEHPSCLSVKSPKLCYQNQVDHIYEHGFVLPRNKDLYHEEHIGCPNKCFFCHYSFVRKFSKETAHYERFGGLDGYGNALEIDMFNMDAIEKFGAKAGMFIIGLDGVSERIRFGVNKRISNAQVLKMFDTMDRVLPDKRNTVMIKMYNITGFETESLDDFNDFVECCRKYNGKKRISITLHTTPLNPSCCTPSAFAPMSKVDYFFRNKGCFVLDIPNLTISHSQFNPSPTESLRNTIISRFEEKHRKLLDFWCFNKKFQSLTTGDQWRCVEHNFDIGDILREYSNPEELPTYHNAPYFGWDAVWKMRQIMKKRLYGQQ